MNIECVRANIEYFFHEIKSERNKKTVKVERRKILVWMDFQKNEVKNSFLT